MKTSTEKKISVIINCRNGEEFLGEAIDSVINQSYENWELIFLDNSSTDKSISIAKSYDNKKIKIFNSIEYLICGEARNLAISKASGDYIAFLDADDIWDKNKLEMQLNLIKKKNNKIIYCNSFIKNKSLKILSKKKLPEGKLTKKIINDNPIIFSSAMFHSELFFKENYKFDKYEIIEDLDLFFRLSKKYEFCVIQNPLVIYRDHQNMISKKKFELHINELSEWAEKYKNEIDEDDLDKMINKIYYNKSSISLKYYHFDDFFENLKFVKQYNLIIKLLIKFIIQKVKRLKK